MPRKKPMPPNEQAICLRLREFRLSTGLSQAEFSRLAGLDQRAYAGYEYARSQLNYPAAWRILRAFRQLNPAWLAGEDEAMLDLYFVSYPSPETTGLGPRAPFSLVYQNSLQALLLLSRSAAGVSTEAPFPLFRVGGGIAGRLEGRQIFSDILSGWLAAQPDVQINDFLNDLLRRCSQTLQAFPQDKDGAAVARRVRELLEADARMKMTLDKYSQNLGLTDITVFAKYSAVKSQMLSLLARLKRAASPRGMKSKLAKRLGVPLSNVSQWLSGEREPGGETTLRLLHWVEQQERQQNTLGSAINTTKGKATRQKLGYETEPPSSHKKQ